jgi:hypothetical protein
MKYILSILLFISSLTSYSQGGDKIIVYPEGAYVPNWWIDKAVDSTGVWREGTAKFYIALQRLSSQQKEINLLEEKYTKYKSACDKSIDEANNEITLAYQKNAELSNKISKLKPWATIGKVSTITVSIGVITTAIVIIRNELSE